MLFRLLFGSARVMSWTVFERPDPPADRIDRAEALLFVKDGFSMQALLFAPLWLLGQRAWIEFALYCAALTALLAGAAALDVSPVYLTLGLLGLHLLVGFEAGTIERSALRRRGFNEISEVTGTSEHDAERRFLDVWLPMQRAVRGSSVPAAGPSPTAAGGGAGAGPARTLAARTSPWWLPRLLGGKG